MQHPDSNSMEAFSRRTLSPAEMLELSDHLAACDACRERMESLALDGRAPQVEWFPSDGSSLHLSEEELASAAQYGDEAETHTREHLAECAQCRAGVEDVRRFFSPVVVMQTREPASAGSRGAWMRLAGAGLLAASVAAFAFEAYTHRSLARQSPQMVAELQDGSARVGLDGHGQLQGLGPLPGEDSALLAQVLTTHRLPMAQVTLAGGANDEMLRGGESAAAGFSVLSPFREKTLAAPTFRWQPLAGATSYVVEIHDEAFHLVARSPRLTQTEWTPPQALSSGREFSWVVKAETAAGTVQTPQPPMPEAHFVVASAEDRSAIDAARKQAGDSHLLLAATYARLGLTSEARAEMHVLQEQNPGSPLVNELANSVTRLR